MRCSDLALVSVFLLLAACGGDVQGAADVAADSSSNDLSVDAKAREEPGPYDWGQPDQPPDKTCHALKRAPDSDSVKLALEIAHKQIEDHPAETLAWNWEEAILLVAMIELHKVTNNASLIEYCRAYMDHHIEVGYVIGMSDNCVPSAIAIALYEVTGEEKYLEVAEDALHYLYEVALRTDEGGISHLGTIDIVTLWVDSLVMFGTVFMYWAETTGDTEALVALGDQFDIFTSRLQETSGFYKHADPWIVEQTPGIYWGRGNGWVAVAAYQYLRLLANRGETHDSVAVAAGRLLDASIETQDQATGLWWTILNKPGQTYLETSATALFAYGMARAWRYGFVGDEVLQPLALAMKGVNDMIVEDGQGRPVVTGISGPTTADKYEVYAGIAVEDDLPYGLGAVILALVETSGLPGM